jgi:hypothetical protein
MPIYTIILDSDIDPRVQVGDYLISYFNTSIQANNTTFLEKGYQGTELQNFNSDSSDIGDIYDPAKVINFTDTNTNVTSFSENNDWNAIKLLGPITNINREHRAITVDINQPNIVDADINLPATYQAAGLTIGLSVVKNDFVEKSGVKGYFMTAKFETNSTTKKELFEVGSNIIVNSA